MREKIVLAFDVGTQSSRALLINSSTSRLMFLLILIGPNGMRTCISKIYAHVRWT